MNQQTSPSSTTILNCDGPGFKRLAAAGLAWLEQNYELVNQSNVFPVPDGDTGTNMLLTLRSAYREIAANESTEVGVIADKLAYGAIMGSRGNSGTILSQLFRGFAQSVSGLQEFDADRLAVGFREAVKMAYKAVQTPVEGTILTVARETAEEIEAAAAETKDLRPILERVVGRAKDAVARTPEMLPILKKAGVVDSGGQGLAFILEGMLRHAQGEILTVGATGQAVAAGSPLALHDVLRASDERGYGYDVQYILHGKNLDLDTVRAAIGSMGDSMVVVGDSSLIKVHIHVHDPGIPISYGISLGIISDVVVENMQEQSEEYIAKREGGDEIPLDEPIVTVNEGDVAIVTVAPGEGFKRLFRDLGAAAIVSGGQTMNPSTEEIFQAIMDLPTDKVIVLPNNKNIVLAAELAATLAAQNGKEHVTVIPSRTIPQGISAMLSFSPDGDFENVVTAMQNARNNVITGEVTTATRSVDIDGVKVESGQIIGLMDGKLVVSGNQLPEVVHELLERMSAPEHEVITLYYGDHVAEEEAAGLADLLRSQYPDQEFDVIHGGQPHYHYILSAE